MFDPEGSIHEEHITLNVYVPNHRTSKYMKQKWIRLKKKKLQILNTHIFKDIQHIIDISYAGHITSLHKCQKIKSYRVFYDQNRIKLEIYNKSYIEKCHRHMELE